jgi:glycosyltransferase involved in cell wall biosynthesis
MTPEAPRRRVSFVIPVKNDAGRLRRCLQSIAANSYPRDAVEIIVADNGSVDGSPDVAASSGATVLRLPGYRVSEVRNRAAAAASGDIFAFVDADHEISPLWIDAAADALTDEGAGAVGALCRPPSNGTWVQQMYGVLRGSTVGRRDVEWLGAGNMAVRREAFQAVGGFDLTLESCEDVDLCQRLRNAGWRVVGDERLDNVHLGDPATLGQLFRAERWRGRNNLRVTFQPAWTWRSIVSGVIPIVQMIAIALFVALAAASVWWNRLPWVAFVLLAAAAVAPSLARTLRMTTSGRLSSAGRIAQALCVALTFDMARAVALVGASQHHRQPVREDST